MATTENHEFVAAYGHDRVRVTPISETAEIGMAIGAAMAGLRPVVELYMRSSCSSLWIRSSTKRPASAICRAGR